MKELSIEEKAKRYDEVMPQLKGLLDGIHEEKCDIMEEDIIKIFPELKENENEDERIKNEIIAFLREGKPYHCLDSIKRKEWIAWIEKHSK